MLRTPKLAAFILLSVFFSFQVFPADSEAPLVIQRLQGEFIFDGIPDEPAWEKVDPFPMITHTPVFGKEPEERSEVRMIFDVQFIYVGASFYTGDPSKIMSTSKKRDDLKQDCDWLGVVFDSYNDNETGLVFWTTPTGLRADMAVFNDAQGELIPPINTA